MTRTKVEYTVTINGIYSFYGDNTDNQFIQEQIAEEIGIPLEYIDCIEYTLSEIQEEDE